MNPIINPMYFYWIDVLDTFKGVSIAMAVILGIFLIIYALHIFAEDIEINKIFLVSLISGFIIFLLTFTFVPSKNTMILMFLSKEVTYNRLILLSEKIGELKDEAKADVIDIIGELKSTKQDTLKAK